MNEQQENYFKDALSIMTIGLSDVKFSSNVSFSISDENDFVTRTDMLDNRFTTNINMVEDLYYEPIKLAPVVSFIVSDVVKDTKVNLKEHVFSIDIPDGVNINHLRPTYFKVRDNADYISTTSPTYSDLKERPYSISRYDYHYSFQHDTDIPSIPVYESTFNIRKTSSLSRYDVFSENPRIDEIEIQSDYYFNDEHMNNVKDIEFNVSENQYTSIDMDEVFIAVEEVLPRTLIENNVKSVTVMVEDFKPPSFSGQGGKAGDLESIRYVIQQNSFAAIRLRFTTDKVDQVLGLPQGLRLEGEFIKGSPVLNGLYPISIILTGGSILQGIIEVPALKREL